MPTLNEPVLPPPRSRMYFGPATDQVDEYGVPLTATGERQADNTVVSNGRVQPPLPQMQPPPIETIQFLQANEAARKAAAARQYQDEVESADRLRRQQAIQGLLDAGLRPPAALSSTATPPPILRTLGNQIYSFDRATGQPSLAVAGTPKPPQRQRGYTQAEVDSYGPLESGYEWAPSSYPGYFEPVRKRQPSGLEAILGGVGGLTPPATQPSISGRVRVVSPNGVAGSIPASQLDSALKAGYTRQ